MTTLGIVTCQILELEFAHVLSNDPDIREIRVEANPFSMDLIETLERDGSKRVCKVLPEETSETDETIGLVALIRVMEVGLHSNIQNLRREVLAAVKELAPFVDAVLLGYGLCGNALNNAADLFGDIPVPVMLPTQNEEPVDDCVGLIIGGRENYYEEQRRCAGTMFMNAGFSRHWENILSMDIPPNLMHKKDKILERIWGNYERSLLLPTPVLDESALRKNTKKFVERFGLKTEIRPGTLSLLENAWKKVKKFAI